MTGTYHIWPITIGLIVAYLFSLAGMRLGIFRLAAHRRFWNVLLLLNFLTTALIGMLLTLQVNYKFTLPGEDTWMLVHVDTGIAMTLIGLFHLGWHLWFYAAIFHRKKRATGAKGSTAKPSASPLPGRDVQPAKTDILPLPALGFTAMITQLVLLRAFISVFQGNELVIGIILGNWMLLTGLGARLGRAAPRMKNSSNFLFSGLIWLGTLPVLTLFLLFFLKNIVFIPGSLAGLFAVFLSSLVLLFPFCFLSGYSFSFYTWHISEKYKANLTGRSYAWEAFGSLTGGFLFSFILVFLLKPFHTLGIVLLADLFVVILMIRKNPDPPKTALWLIPPSVLAVALFLFPVDLYSIHFLYPHQKILTHRETPFGSLVVTKMGDQLNLYENHVMVAHTLSPTENEEDVHYAMVQRPAPRQVLLISGGISGTLQEILKYSSVTRIDYLEINPRILRLAKKYFPVPDDPRIHYIIRDARRYVPRCREKYDVVLVNVPPPTTAQINRYYTVDFFKSLRQVLNPGGVVSLRLPASPNYMARQETDLNAILFATLKDVFPHVVIIPGGKNYFLASDQPLSLHIAALVTQRGITNKYVSPYYIQDDLLQMRNEQVMAQLGPISRLNSDMNPVAYFNQITLWLSYYRFDTRFLLWTLAALFLFLLLRSGPLAIGIFTAGFAASAVEMLLLFIFQIIYGYVYLMTGILITLFMAGIAVGARYPLPLSGLSRLSPFKRFTGTGLLIALAAATLPLLVVLLRSITATAPGEGVLLLYTFSFAYLTGRLFSLGSTLRRGEASQTASSLYSADLAGGALGALSVAALLLPLEGIRGTAWLITFASFLSVIYLLLRRKKITG